LESLLLTCVIEAKEERDVAVMDIPNAFVQTILNRKDTKGERIIMKLRGKTAELLVRTAPELYRRYITIENGKPVLYVELLRALYGMLMSALLFYKQFVRDLKEIGFELNPYDICVANRMVNGKQHTVAWHVDDLKSSHKDKKVNDEFIEYLRSKYEDKEIGLLKATRGSVHEYLGMTLDYSIKGEVRIGMSEYVKKMIEHFGEDLSEPAKTPAAQHLFQVREDAQPLNEKQAQKFHNTVAKGLFLCKRARLDLQTTIAFLSTRVKNPDEDDWKKIMRMMRYLNKTKNMIRIIKADNLNMIKWYIDAAHTVHADLKGHTGGALTLGKGAITTKSNKQKLNTRSSTETEIVGVDDLMPEILWTNLFLKEQGYETKGTILYQDNKSTMIWMKNGRQSLGKRAKHINVRYFFVKDRIEKGEIKVEHCPTDDMMADFFTKPLQGQNFI
jgi:hypothetical protein